MNLVNNVLELIMECINSAKTNQNLDHQLFLDQSKTSYSAIEGKFTIKTRWELHVQPFLGHEEHHFHLRSHESEQ